MKKQDYDKTGFYCGIKAKVAGHWLPVITTDFDTRETTCKTNLGETVYSLEAVEEFSQLEK